MTTKRWLLVLVGLIVVVIVYILTTFKTSPTTVLNNSSDKTFVATDSATVNPDVLSGIQTGQAPWTAETDHLQKRLDTIGLPALTAEGTALHIHQHIDIYINGQHIIVPEGIGINETAQFISPIHTHDTTGVIHVESPTIQTFTLGQFFDIWGVKFTNSCIGGYCSNNDKQLHVFANGKEYTGNFRDLALEAHQEIVVTYGITTVQPSPIPSSYTFPSGE